MPITVLRAGSEGIPPLVCVHPIAGSAEVYQALAAAVDWRGPVLGASAPEPGAAGFTLRDLAASYCEALPPGCLLLGWALGGVIAAQMSRTIVDRGGEVQFLGLLDSRAPQPEMKTRPTDRDTLVRFFLQQAAFMRERAPIQAPSSAPGDVLAALRLLGAADELPDESALERKLAVFIAIARAFYAHEPQPVPVPVHLFEAADAHPLHPRPPTLGWEPLAAELVRHSIEGTHFTLLAPARSAGLADAINRYLPR